MGSRVVFFLNTQNKIMKLCAERMRSAIQCCKRVLELSAGDPLESRMRGAIAKNLVPRAHVTLVRWNGKR